MAGTLVMYERPDHKWGWRLRGDNFDDIVATDGGQGYNSKSFCKEMAEKVISGHYRTATQIEMPFKKSA